MLFVERECEKILETPRLNRTNSEHRILRFLLLPHQLYVIYMKIFHMNQYFKLKSYTNTKATIDGQHKEREQL